MATAVLQATPRQQVSRGHDSAEFWPWPWRCGWRATIELPTDRRSPCPLVVTGEKGSRPAEVLGQADAVKYEDKPTAAPIARRTSHPWARLAERGRHEPIPEGALPGRQPSRRGAVRACPEEGRLRHRGGSRRPSGWLRRVPWQFYDVILADDALPQFNARQALQMVRERGPRRALPGRLGDDRGGHRR